VSKTSLYRLVDSKDALIAAFAAENDFAGRADQVGQVSHPAGLDRIELEQLLTRPHARRPQCSRTWAIRHRSKDVGD
jgi:hypothetical protein